MSVHAKQGQIEKSTEGMWLRSAEKTDHCGLKLTVVAEPLGFPGGCVSNGVFCWRRENMA